MMRIILYSKLATPVFIKGRLWASIGHLLQIKDIIIDIN